MFHYEFLSDIPYKKRDVYATACNLLHKLTPSESKAIKFSYESEKKAVTARTTLNKYIKANRMPFEATQRGSDVIVYKKQRRF